MLDHAGDLAVPPLHPVAQPDGSDPPVGVAGPGVHRHRVGVVQEQRTRLGDLANVPADVQQRGDGALAVHDAPGADGVADALIDAVLQRDLDVEFEGFQPPLPDGADHIVGVPQRLTPVRGRRQGGGEVIRGDVALAQLRHHVQVVPVYVHQGDVRVLKLRHRQDVLQQAAGESYRSRPNHRYLYRHVENLLVLAGVPLQTGYKV